MTADVEKLIRGEIRVDLIEGSFQILWLLLPDDHACRRELTDIVGVLLFGTFHHVHLWMSVCISRELRVQHVRRRREDQEHVNRYGDSEQRQGQGHNQALLGEGAFHELTAI